VHIAPSVEKLQAMRPKHPPKRVDFTAAHLHQERHGEQVVTIATGDVIVSQGSPAVSGEYLELRADAAVLYLKGDKLGAALSGKDENANNGRKKNGKKK